MRSAASPIKLQNARPAPVRLLDRRQQHERGGVLRELRDQVAGDGGGALQVAVEVELHRPPPAQLRRALLGRRSFGEQRGGLEMKPPVRQQLRELEPAVEPVGVGCEHRPLHRLRRLGVAGLDERPRPQRLDHRLTGAQLRCPGERLDGPLRFVLTEIDLTERHEALEVVGLGDQHELEGEPGLDARARIAVGEVHGDARLGPQDLRLGRGELARDPHLHRGLFEAPGAGQDARILQADPGIFRGQRRRLGVSRECGCGLAIGQQRAAEQKGIGGRSREIGPQWPGRLRSQGWPAGRRISCHTPGNHSRTGTFPAGPTLISWRTRELSFDSYN